LTLVPGLGRGNHEIQLEARLLVVTMDGMLFVAFFFPLILSAGILTSVLAFLFALWAGFGPELAQVIRSNYTNSGTTWSLGLALRVLDNPPLRQYGWIVYPVLLNIVLAACVFSTYSLGKLLYSKKGWKFAQPMKGGLRFVLLQATLWTMFSVALILPWLTMEGVGILSVFNIVEDSGYGDGSFGGLLVSSAALGMIVESLVVVALMVFDSSSKDLYSEDLRTLEIGAWNWSRMFGKSSSVYWWLFMSLQTVITLYAGTMAVLAEKIVQNKVVECLMAMVFVALLCVAISVTNAVGGKWRHGAVAYHIFMPFRGGILFSVLQGIGWLLFSAALLGAFIKIGGLFWLKEHAWHSGSLIYAGGLGFASQCIITASLVFFDPKKAGRSLLIRKIEQIHGSTMRISNRSARSADFMTLRGPESEEGFRKNPNEGRLVHRIIGKRVSKTDAVEYLVTWSGSENATGWVSLATLLKQVNTANFSQAMAAYEKQRAEVLRCSAQEVDHEEEEEQRSEMFLRTSKASPALKRKGDMRTQKKKYQGNPKPR